MRATLEELVARYFVLKASLLGRNQPRCCAESQMPLQAGLGRGGAFNLGRMRGGGGWRDGTAGCQA